MFLCFCIILFIVSCCLESADEARRISEYHRERRHEEVMEAQERRHRELMESRRNRRTVTRHRIMRDEKGRFISEKVTVSGVSDE